MFFKPQLTLDSPKITVSLGEVVQGNTANSGQSRGVIPPPSCEFSKKPQKTGGAVPLPARNCDAGREVGPPVFYHLLAKPPDGSRIRRW